MILKQIGQETHRSKIQILNTLLKNSTSDKQKDLIRKERAKLTNGHKAEEKNAYYINSNLDDSKNTVVLHDIRLEHNGKSAQFDHILVNRIEIVILESKSFKDGTLTIKNDGSLEVKYGKKTYTQNTQLNKTNAIKEY